MLPTTAKHAADIVHGRLLSGPADAEIKGLTIDSREVQPGFIFAAFTGAQADGHDFIPQAIERGATAVLATRQEPFKTPDEAAVIHTDDPLTALQELAVYERSRFTGPVVAVTGSNGKTTTKEMLKSVFSTTGPCLATKQNQNNELGVPLTILGHQPTDASFVIEMGMRARGEIGQLCSIAKPTTGVITNIGHSHLELLGSQEQIALAKTELLEDLPQDGYAVLYGDDPWLRKLAYQTQAQVLWFGLSQKYDAWAENISTQDNFTVFTAHVLGDSAEVTLPALGEHNVLNALAALLAGAANGLQLKSMVKALYQISSTSGRLHQVDGRRNRTVIDDCYNASPSSMKASLQVLKEISLQKQSEAAAVLGDMYELGSYEEEGHKETGAFAAEIGIQHLIVIGEKAQWIAEGARQRIAKGDRAGGEVTIHEFADKTALLEKLGDLLPPDSIVLVKASRGMYLEDVVRALT